MHLKTYSLDISGTLTKKYILTSFATSDHTRALAFHATRYTPLHYAAQFSPSRVESLLAEGSYIANLKTPLEPALAYAAVRGEADPIELLIDDGANVNKKDKLGRTALHWACYYCRYHSLLELLQHIEGKIDWQVCIPEGYNALDLFEMGSHYRRDMLRKPPHRLATSVPALYLI